MFSVSSREVILFHARCHVNPCLTHQSLQIFCSTLHCVAHRFVFTNNSKPSTLFLLFFCSQYCTSSKLIVVLRCFVSVWRQTANGGTNWKYWFHCFGVALEVYWLDKISWRNNRWGKISYSLLFSQSCTCFWVRLKKAWFQNFLTWNPFLVGVQTISKWQIRVWRCDS